MGVVSIMTVLHIKERHIAEFTKMALASARKSVRTEEKCLALEISRDDKKPGRFPDLRGLYRWGGARCAPEIAAHAQDD